MVLACFDLLFWVAVGFRELVPLWCWFLLLLCYWLFAAQNQWELVDDFSASWWLVTTVLEGRKQCTFAYSWEYKGKLTFLSGCFNGLHHKKKKTTTKKIITISGTQAGFAEGKYWGKELKLKRFVPFIGKKVGHNKQGISARIRTAFWILGLVFVFLIWIWMFCFTWVPDVQLQDWCQMAAAECSHPAPEGAAGPTPPASWASHWIESSGGLWGWWGDWSISPTRRGWGSWACSAWRREGCEGTL